MARTATSPTAMPISALLAEDSSLNNHENISEKDIDNVPQFSLRKRSYLQTLANKLGEIENEEIVRTKCRRIAFENSLEDRLHSRASLSNHIAYASLRDLAAANVLRQIEHQERERRRAYQRIAQRKRRQALKGSTAPASDGEVAEDASIDAASVNGEDTNRSALDSETTLPTRRKRAASRRALDAAAAAANNEEDASIESDEPHAEPETAVKRKVVLSKNYNTVYETIFKDIARKDVPKVYRILITSVHNKQSNARKTAQLAAKEARRWQFRTNKSIKDLQNRAKRGMREMLVFWKRNEREEREQRRRAEKEALELAKREEEQREARRQARKLNFLITQTELYSHFVGKKIKTDELEGTATPSGNATPSITEVETPTSKQIGSTDVKTLDFDSVDETDLRNMAMTNAQNAVADAKSRAEKFNAKAAADTMDQLDDNGELNFQNPTSLGDIEISQPKLLSCTLKEYQMKGLNWLVNLYEQGINGILADEMGLGKTVQSISVMAYLAETHNIWGPFLVIAPASTLHNWQQEISRFLPEFKILPYWGSGKDRKVLRKFWDRKHPTYTRDSPFHVLVTSYQLVVADAPHFLRLKWQYMILDEAQAIKSSSSSRWKSLLSLHCRNRLLLTGTPIQNTMQELWALLHFIMPTLFDSHDEFSEWFSKDIESHAQSNTQLNEAQLRRLHMILKPFMLRRVKKNVQSELGDKIEVDVFCKLTYTQRALYRQLKSQINLDLIEKAAIGGDDDSLMNLVMQFRKVCNHPDLFERADTASPYSFGSIPLTGAFMREGNQLYLSYSAKNLINYNLPNLLYKEGGIFEVPGTSNTFAGFKKHYIDNIMSVWTPDYIQHEEQLSGSSFGWLSFADVSGYEAHKIATRGIFERTYDLVVNSEINYKPRKSKLEKLLTIPKQGEPLDVDPNSILYDLYHVSHKRFKEERLDRIEPIFDPRATAPPIEVTASEGNWINRQRNIMFNPVARSLLFGKPEEMVNRHLYDWSSLCQLAPIKNRLPQPSSDLRSYSSIRVPSMGKFILASGKLSKLDSLLANLKVNDHRVLIYFQMTRMMDLMEEYLTYRQYRYLRLDGSSKLSDRRDLVHDWQTRPELFVFLLSTRAGGLGINLTAADTVIFYDSDWNPTIDSQAMDRAHRLGQTKQVTVYRLLVRGTIEEKMRDRAKQKMHVQQVVMEGGKPSVDLNANKPQPSREVAMWLLDDATADGSSGMEGPDGETVVS